MLVKNGFERYGLARKLLHRPGDAAAVDDRPPPVILAGRLDPPPLKARREELVGPVGLERRQELAIGQVQGGDLDRVVGRQQPDHAARRAAPRSAGQPERIHCSSSGSRRYERPLIFTKSRVLGSIGRRASAGK